MSEKVIRGDEQDSNPVNAGAGAMFSDPALNSRGICEDDTVNRDAEPRLQQSSGPLLHQKFTVTNANIKTPQSSQSLEQSDAGQVQHQSLYNVNRHWDNYTVSTANKNPENPGRIAESPKHESRKVDQTNNMPARTAAAQKLSPSLKPQVNKDYPPKDNSTEENPTPEIKKLLSREKLSELLSWVDSSGKLEPEVEELLSDIAEDFVLEITERACRLAVHRNSSTVAIQDFKLPLEVEWNINVVGFTFSENDPDTGQLSPSRDL